jgi:hypothetical protein
MTKPLQLHLRESQAKAFTEERDELNSKYDFSNTKGSVT